MLENSSLFVIILLILVGVLAVWYLSRNIHKFPDGKVIDLSGDDNHLQPWLEVEVKKHFSILEPQDVAQLFLKKALNLEVEKEYLAIGVNLYEKYHKFYKEEPSSYDFYDLRELIGLNFQIIACQTRRQAERLTEYLDYSRIVDVLEEPGALEMIRPYLIKTMDWRWSKIMKIFDVRRTGSYLYLPRGQIPNVLSQETKLGQRYNLLGTEKEFIAFIERLEKVRHVLL